jgi:class 3 adenylate cyclase/tetratricopeptide (TPR) repeat protein
VITCPSCGEENPEHARFCLACGAALAAPEQRRKERKYATALFADLVGSTTLAEREDPEVVQSVVGRAFDRLAEEIGRYEGLLEKFMGDAVLAVFGVPRAHEDDAERAVRAALEMQAVLSELNRSFAAEGKPELAMRIGVEAGEVLVDQERARGARDRMLTGDAVNTAARLQTAADPGHVVVGPGVYASTKEVIDFRELPALELKGKAEPVMAWEALRVKAKHRGERPHLGLEARLIGRDEELAVLKQTLRRVESEARPALVTIIGPAGVGKSRLVHELERYVEGLPQFIYWRRGRCLAYGNASYSALADAIKAQCEILEDDPQEVAIKKTDASVRELFGDEALAPQLRALVGAGEAKSMSREDLFEGWRRFLERLAARYPLVLVLEDIHWADDGLLDFIEHVADWAQGPVMVVTLARPELFEQRPAWGGGKRNAASIYLDPLSPEEGGAMLNDLLAGELPPALARTIVERSEGNPLYVEEIVRMLIDDGVLRATEASRWEAARPLEAVELPRSIQGLIAARLDGLPDDEKLVLQDASVIGREFWAGAVAELTGKSAAEVRDALGRLRVKELILPHDPSSFSDEAEFAFRHLLIRDGAYDSLPKSLRAEKHEQVARWAEQRAGDRADEMAELIATHHLEALRYLGELGDVGTEREELHRDAYRWARAAGDRANALWLRAEAVRWYQEALHNAEAGGIPVADRASLARDLTDVAWGTVAVEESAQACREALRLSEEAGDERGAGWSQAQLVLMHLQSGDDESAIRDGEAAIARLEPFGETWELAEALHLLGWFHWRRGHDEAGDLLRRAVAMATRVDAPLAVRASATQTLAVYLAQIGAKEALPAIEEAFVLAKEAGDSGNLLRVYNNLASIVSDFASDYRRAHAILLEGLELARKGGSVGHQGWLLGSLGDITFSLGELEASERYQRESLEIARTSGDEPLVGMRLSGLAAAVLTQGRIEEGRTIEDEARTVLAANPEPQADQYVFLNDGMLAVASGDDGAAAERFRGGVELIRRFSVESGGPLFVELVRALVRLGDIEEARKYLDLSTAARSPSARAHARTADGLVQDDPAAAVTLLREAGEAFGELGQPIEEARARLDLGRAMARAGQDPGPTFERARELLVGCGAGLFLPEVDAEIAGLG